MLSALPERAEARHDLSRDELVGLLGDEGGHDALLAAADRVRARHLGPAVHLRGLIEFTNRCDRACHYCGLRRDNRALPRYRLEPAAIVAAAERARGLGYGTVVLQSGEGHAYRHEELCEVVRAVKGLGLAVTLSVGEKPRRAYADYRAAGADRYLLRIETTDRDLYAALHPGQRFENRLRCLRDLKALGYELGTGCLVGLPGQTLASLADDVLFFRAVGADMVGVGPFIPHPDTPLGDAPAGSLRLALRVMALTRLLLPDIHIPATTAMETLDPGGRMRALQGGADVVMPNVTTGDARRLYALYPGKACAGETPEQCQACLGLRIAAIGRTVGTGPGGRVRVAPAAT